MIETMHEDVDVHGVDVEKKVNGVIKDHLVVKACVEADFDEFALHDASGDHLDIRLDKEARREEVTYMKDH